MCGLLGIGKSETSGRLEWMNYSAWAKLNTIITLSLSRSATKMKLPNFSDGCFFSFWLRLIRLCKNRNISPARFLGLTYAFRNIFGYILIENQWNKKWSGNVWNYFVFQLASFFHDFHYYLGFTAFWAIKRREMARF